MPTSSRGPHRSTAGMPRALTISRQRTPHPSARGKALQALTGLLPGGRKPATAARSGGKASAGAAVPTAATGVAFQNRDKLTSVFKGRADRLREHRD